MHSILDTFLHALISGEKKKRLQERITGLYPISLILLLLLTLSLKLTAKRSVKMDPTQYLEQMIENDYPYLPRMTCRCRHHQTHLCILPFHLHIQNPLGGHGQGWLLLLINTFPTRSPSSCGDSPA